MLTDPHTIAKGLPRIALDLIFLDGFSSRECHASLVRPLVKRGMFRRIEQAGFATRYEITSEGLAVRQALKEMTDGSE